MDATAPVTGLSCMLQGTAGLLLVDRPFCSTTVAAKTDQGGRAGNRHLRAIQDGVVQFDGLDERLTAIGAAPILVNDLCPGQRILNSVRLQALLRTATKRDQDGSVING